jgi:uncharacterized membrane protein YjfL (UPF0719 family)
VLLAEVTADGVVATLVYGVVGAAMLAIGVVALDMATPGSLSARVRQDQSWNAGVLTAANLLAVATIVATAGVTSTDDTLAEGILTMVVYGAIGIVLQVVLLVAVERNLRPELDEMLQRGPVEPLALALSAASVALGIVTAVAVS